MANITITVQSMLNAAVHDSYTISETALISTLKTNIQTATGCDTTWFSLVFANEVLDPTKTLAFYNIVSGSSLRTANKISRLGTRELRQKSKLDLAALSRLKLYNSRSTYDLTELPTQYVDNDVYNNPNTTGLTQGRPWILSELATAIEIFTTVGSTTWTAPAGTTSVEYLVVGGGGGAGNGYDNAGGGGGGAGMVLTGTVSVTPGQTYDITVGDGGAGGADARANNPGTAGSPSAFDTITSLGGGQGLGSRTGAAAGAAQVSNTTAPTGGGGTGGGQGGKGGGGSTGAGSVNSGATGGSGGAGTSLSILGSSITFGVGGDGGGAGTPTTDGNNGTANRGNGGQGGKSGSADSAKGGNGGSGIVALKFLKVTPFSFYESFGTTAAISTTQYVSGNKIYAYASTYDVPSPQPARVVVNDIEVLLHGDSPLPYGRGHNLVVLDSYGDVVTPAAQYDTYIDPNNLTSLASALNAVASGNIVVLVTYDASALNSTVRTAINTGYGATNSNTWTSSRTSQIFIGIKV